MRTLFWHIYAAPISSDNTHYNSTADVFVHEIGHLLDYIRGEVHVSTKEEKDKEEIKVTVNFEQHMEMKWGEQLRVYDPNHFVQYTRVSDPFEWGYLS